MIDILKNIWCMLTHHDILEYRRDTGAGFTDHRSCRVCGRDF